MAYDSKYGYVTVENDSPNNPLNDTEEPVFLLRANDKTILRMIDVYAEAVAEEGADPEFIVHVGKTQERFEDWQREHPELVKVPD